MQRLTNDSSLFTGQYFDSEIEEYYLRARQYDPRFTRPNCDLSLWIKNGTANKVHFS